MRGEGSCRAGRGWERWREEAEGRKVKGGRWREEGVPGSFVADKMCVSSGPSPLSHAFPFAAGTFPLLPLPSLFASLTLSLFLCHSASLSLSLCSPAAAFYLFKRICVNYHFKLLSEREGERKRGRRKTERERERSS